MKQKIKKARLALLFGMLLMGSAYSQTGKLYVYGTNGSKQEIAVSDVWKLTFTESALVINKADKTTSISLNFTDLDLFSLTEYNNSSIPQVTTRPGAEAYFDASGTLFVKNAEVMTSVALFNLQGQKLLQAAPNVAETSISVSDLPAGVYLLKVSSEKRTGIKKIIKK